MMYKRTKTYFNNLLKENRRIVYYFIDFLKKQNLWEEFVTEKELAKSSETFYDYSTVDKARDIILMAFEWDHSAKGYDFWCSINDAWVEKVAKMYRNKKTYDIMETLYY